MRNAGLRSLSPADTILAVDSVALQYEIMALLNFAFTYGMASRANDRAASDALHEGFLEGFHPIMAEQDICEYRVREYVAALKQETEDWRKLHAVGGVFANTSDMKATPLLSPKS